MLGSLSRLLLRHGEGTKRFDVIARCVASGAVPSGEEPAWQGTSEKTHFGYQEVDAADKAGMVGGVFSSVAQSYDLMNDLMSGGVHRIWKDRLVSQLQPFAGMQHLDVAGGTGDIAFRVLQRMREAEADAVASAPQQQGSVIVADINAEMLAEGRSRAVTRGFGSDAGLSWLQADAMALPCSDEAVDSYTIAFGIRNVTSIPAALEEAYRVLRPGGRFMCLEFSHVVLPGLKELYETYSFNVIPQIGRFVANDQQSYQYLVESIRQFPPQDEFADMITDAGFAGVKYENLTGGIVAIHSGTKWR